MTKPEKEVEEPVLVAAAKKLGAAAGKLASLAGVTGEPATRTKPAKAARFVKKNKARLPRREKKEQKKAAAKAV